MFFCQQKPREEKNNEIYLKSLFSSLKNKSSIPDDNWDRRGKKKKVNFFIA